MTKGILFYIHNKLIH